MSASVADGSGAPPPEADTPDPGADDHNLHATAARIDSLLEASAAGGPGAQSRAEDLVACVSGLYGAGLRRVLEILDSHAALGNGVLEALVSDELVSGLLLVHDLHPHDLRTRVGRALDSVRPYLGSHGGDVELVSIDDDGVVTLGLLGSCDGCPSSSVTLELAVETAVREAAPEVSRIEVRAAKPAAAKAGLIGLDSLRSRIDRPDDRAAGTWVAMPDLAELASGELGGFDVDGLAVCACRIGADLFCFRDACGHCGQSLAGSVVERRLGAAVGTGVLRCARCHAHFDVRQAGAGLDDPAEHLEPLPVLIRDGAPAVAVPAAAP